MLLEQGSNNIDRTTELSVVRTILLSRCYFITFEQYCCNRLDALTILLRAVGANAVESVCHCQCRLLLKLICSSVCQRVFCMQSISSITIFNYHKKIIKMNF